MSKFLLKVRVILTLLLVVLGWSGFGVSKKPSNMGALLAEGAFFSIQNSPNFKFLVEKSNLSSKAKVEILSYLKRTGQMGGLRQLKSNWMISWNYGSSKIVFDRRVGSKSGLKSKNRSRGTDSKSRSKRAGSNSKSPRARRVEMSFAHLEKKGFVIFNGKRISMGKGKRFFVLVKEFQKALGVSLPGRKHSMLRPLGFLIDTVHGQIDQEEVTLVVATASLFSRWVNELALCHLVKDPKYRSDCIRSVINKLAVTSSNVRLECDKKDRFKSLRYDFHAENDFYEDWQDYSIPASISLEYDSKGDLVVARSSLGSQSCKFAVKGPDLTLGFRIDVPNFNNKALLNPKTGTCRVIPFFIGSYSHYDNIYYVENFVPPYPEFPKFKEEDAIFPLPLPWQRFKDCCKNPKCRKAFNEGGFKRGGEELYKEELAQ